MLCGVSKVRCRYRITSVRDKVSGVCRVIMGLLSGDSAPDHSPNNLMQFLILYSFFFIPSYSLLFIP